VLNSGFQDGLAYWTAKSGSIQIDTTEKHSGTQSVLCLDRIARHNGVEQDMVTGSESRILPNSKYYISCWAKLKNAASDNLQLKLKYEDDAGPHWKGISTTINNNVWTHLEGYITVEVNGTVTVAKLFAEGPDQGVEFWVDDVSAVFMNAVTTSPSSAPKPSPTKVSYIRSAFFFTLQIRQNLLLTFTSYDTVIITLDSDHSSNKSAYSEFTLVCFIIRQ